MLRDPGHFEELVVDSSVASSPEPGGGPRGNGTSLARLDTAWLWISPSTQGASPMSFERSNRLLLASVALASTITFNADDAIARSLFGEWMGAPRDPALGAAFVDDVVVREWLAMTAAVGTERVEDGVEHPAEARLAGFLTRRGTRLLVTWLFRSDVSPSLAADFVRLLGRLDASKVAARRQIVARCLASESAQLRDAAAHAIETWGDASLLDLLDPDQERVAWLADYFRRVARDVRRRVR